MKASVFVGTNLDGFIARTDGTLDFLPSGGGEPHGYNEFKVGAALLKATEDWRAADREERIIAWTRDTI